MIVLSVTKLEETEEQYTHAERRIHTLTCSLDEKGKELSSAAQKLQESLSTSTAYETTIKQLEQDMQRYAQTHPMHKKLLCSLFKKSPNEYFENVYLFKNVGTSRVIINLNVFIIRLEIENARLEATASKQSKEINTLQKGTHEAALVSLIF